MIVKEKKIFLFWIRGSFPRL